MKFKVLIVLVFFLSAVNIQAERICQLTDSLSVNKSELLDPDSLIEKSLELEPGQHENSYIYKSEKKVQENKPVKRDSMTIRPEVETPYYKIPAYIEPVKIDSLILLGNPFFIDLVFMGHSNELKFEFNPDFQTLYFGEKKRSLGHIFVIEPETTSTDKIIFDLRRQARDEITRTSADVYIMSFDELPDPNVVKSRFIEGRSLTNLKFFQDNTRLNSPNKKLYIKNEQLGPWMLKANSLLQFSQNMASDNWYQGGSSNMALLGVLSGQLNYDNKNNIQWENNAEWRLGVNAIFNDTTVKRAINTNDDVLRINSKLGIKAGGNFFYSGSVDFSTQFFNSYKSASSFDLKGAILTPVRLNIGMGLDYKYGKLFSIMVSPLSYKYIYVNDKSISPNLFGIKTGEDHLSEIGSSFKAQCSYSPFRELQIDSRLNFYTNYEKVEIDWEIVSNFTINRFLSTRLSLNPRYDNTIIGQKAYLQFKELLSFGFSYKLLN